MIIDNEDYLAHYGILRRSGRYPWGSGENEVERSSTFLSIIGDLRKQGLSDSEIAKGFKMSRVQLHANQTIARNYKKQADIAMAQSLKDKGTSNVEGARRMGIPESTYRTLIAPGAKDKADVLTATANTLKRAVDNKTYLDIGTGTEISLNVSADKMNVAVAMLEEQGYVKHTVPHPQLGTSTHDTKMKVLTPPGYTQHDVFMNRDKIRLIQEFSDDGGRTHYGIHDPLSINPDRVEIRYGKDGGREADGVIYVRDGVEDISLGGSRYAQVRVKVGDDHYLKGMAMYKDDLPDGVDLVFNTNKSDTGNKTDAMKPFEKDAQGKIDKDNPFGSLIERQILADKGLPTERASSAMNIVNEEGKWGTWSKTLSSQMLSKQPPSLAKEQLDKTYEQRKADLNEIMSLTNPAVKKKLLMAYADSTDSAAKNLKAQALKGQASHVILPIDSMPPHQIYAPNYNNGDRVVLIRHPHAGRFEIPELTVNNKQPEARRLLGNAKDAVGIHSSVAQRLSGADFDGDTVLVIPNKSGKIKIAPALDGLKDFDPIASYPAYEGMPKMTSDRKEKEMGNISNLITDMTIKGASNEKIARAVRHSMVVIDAEKHNLNYKLSAQRNGIAALKEEFQGTKRSGASTLISKKKSYTREPERKPRPQSEGGPINKVTGRKEFVETGKTRVNSAGERVLVRERRNKLAEAEDANILSSGTPIEKLYASHSNRLKSLANQARLETLRTPPIKYNSSANKTYAQEVSSLNSKLTLIKTKRPLERQARVLATAVYREKVRANPSMDDDTRNKIKFQALEEMRRRTGSDAYKSIVIEPKEWDAIQAGAISNHKVTQILAKADLDVVRKLATPRTKLTMSPAKIKRAEAMLSSGATRAEVVAALGVSLTTLDQALGNEGAYER